MAPPGTCPTCERPLEGILCAHCAISGALAADATVGGAPPEVDPQAGSESRYGPYQPVRLLGEGGFGKVFLAEQEEPIRREVALKVLRIGGGDVAQMLARFELERQTLASMNHPSICRVFDAGESDLGEPYFAMELVDGLPINEYCTRRQPSLPALIKLFQRVCAGLDHAHQRGIIHRDLKPGNILVVERDGQPQPIIIDFGIAKVLEPLIGTDPALTGSLQILGSPPYMSPEQAESSGGEADVRSDVYSLGAVLYEVLAGTPPIAPDRLRDVGVRKVIELICEEEPPPPSVRAAGAGGPTSDRGPSPFLSAKRIRGDLDRITLKALAKDRRHRYQSISEFGDDLKRFVEGRPVRAGALGFRYRASKFIKRHPFGVGAIAALIALAFTWLGAREARIRSEARDAESRLLAANAVAAPAMIAEVQPYLGRLDRSLRQVSRDETAPLQARINATLALAAGDDREVAQLSQLLLSGGHQTPLPAQAIAIQGGIAPSPGAVSPADIERAKQILRDPGEPRERRLCAGALLTVSPVSEDEWAKLGPSLARLACSQWRVLATRWAPAFRPAARHLDGTLRELFAADPESESGVAAATVLAEFYAEDAEQLISLASEASPSQFLPLAGAPGARGEIAASEAIRILAKTPAEGEKLTEQELDRLALKRSRSAILLFRDGRGADVWPYLKRPDPGDPRLRTFIIHAMPECGVSPAVPAARLQEAVSASERAALLIALGGYSESEIDDGLRDEVLQKATELTRSDPSAEVHSAAKWLRRSWGHPPDLTEQGSPNPKGQTEGPTWQFDAILKADFAIFLEPVTFLMGSPEDEHGRYEHEFQHQATIPHSFALCTKTLTRAQVETLLAQPAKQGAEVSPPELPGRNISLYQARTLCNKVSELAGVPKDQWCYTGGEKPEPRPNITSLLGYRLPTEQEWEYACRGGATTPRHYGFSEELLPSYACISDYGGALRPPGSKRPNGYGMFDMLGGVQNYIEGEFVAYPGAPNSPSGIELLSIEVPGGSSGFSSHAVRRGQFETESAKHFRSARRAHDITPPSMLSPFTGVRLARSLPANPAAKSALPENHTPNP